MRQQRLLIAAFLGGAACACAADAPRWDVQELALESAREYPNPYLDVEVTAEIQPPSGAPVTVRGFWDGGRAFKIRWTPTEPGRWTYVTRSADAGLGGKRGELRVAAPRAGAHGFLRRDAQYPYSFLFDDGTRYFLFGNTFYGLVTNALSGDNWKTAVDKTRALGMNKIRYYITRQPKEQSAQWIEAAASNRPGVDIFRKADETVRYLAGRGVIADLIVFEREHVDRLTQEQAERFVRYVAARYAAFPNVIFCLQNEWEYTKKPKEFWSAVGRAARAADPWAMRGVNPRGLSVHQQTRYDWQFFGEDWYSHATIQLGVRNRGKAHRGGDEWNLPRGQREVMPYGDDWGNFGIVYNWGRNVPVVNDEYGYIGEPLDETEGASKGGKAVRYTREKHRRTMWGIYVAGGYGSAGDKNDYQDGRPYFSANWHDTPEWGDVERLIRFYTTRGFEYWKMAADNARVKSGKRVYVSANPGKEYIVYAAAGGEFSIDLPGGNFDARRFDPRTGEDTPLQKVSGPGPVSFTMPEGEDWVAYLRKSQPSR